MEEKKLGGEEGWRRRMFVLNPHCKTKVQLSTYVGIQIQMADAGKVTEGRWSTL